MASRYPKTKHADSIAFDGSLEEMLSKPKKLRESELAVPPKTPAQPLDNLVGPRAVASVQRSTQPQERVSS